MFTCPNPSCGRVFATPLNTLNPQDSAKPYPACPYCLTKITEPQTGYIRNEAQDEDHPGKEQSETKDKPQDCRHYKGYLSERKDKQQIPDDCITCRAILDCMLQKMKAET